jgi:hypothetical protein
MAKRRIPPDVEERAVALLQEIASKHRRPIRVQRRGTFLYVGDVRWGQVSPLCRLEYRGAEHDWGFAIYKYSDEVYANDEFFFPECGTLEELLITAFQAYPD